MRTVRIFAALMPFIVSGAFCSAAEWIVDFNEAKVIAEKEGKDILAEFTGSDWCPWCIKLKKEVMDQEAFKNEASKQYVLLELDYPQKKPQAENIKKLNKMLAERFALEPLPTVIMIDSKGRAYARTGQYQPGGIEKWLGILASTRNLKAERDALFAAADKAAGEEKAVLLDRALDGLNKHGCLIGYEETIQDIMKLDGENKKGLLSKYSSYSLLEFVKKKLAAEEYDAALKEIEQYIAHYSPGGNVKQQVYFMKAVALNGKSDNKGALEALEIAHAADPKSDDAATIAKTIADLKK